MFLLALHIIAIGIMVVGVWSVAHRAGMRKGERVLRRRLGLDDIRSEGNGLEGNQDDAAAAPGAEPASGTSG